MQGKKNPPVRVGFALGKGVRLGVAGLDEGEIRLIEAGRVVVSQLGVIEKVSKVNNLLARGNVKGVA